MDHLKERIAVVMGGAHGIGAAIARRFREERAQVVIADVNREAGNVLAGEIDALFAPVDVSDYAAVSRLVDMVIAHHGAFDVVVSNAAVFDEGTVEDNGPQVWQKVLGVNLTPAIIWPIMPRPICVGGRAHLYPGSSRSRFSVRSAASGSTRSSRWPLSRARC